MFLAIVILMMLPIQHSRPAAKKSNCESNLKQIGSAFKMYLQDWQDTYPTNRAVLAQGKVDDTSCSVELTPAEDLPGRNNKGRNLTWVEALYPYMEPPSDLGNGRVDCGAWVCRAACDDGCQSGTVTAYTTYAMNRNLVGRPEKCIRADGELMLLREMDRMADSELRPRNYSCGLPDAPPDSPFLTSRDSRFGRTNQDLHGPGSHIAFADGHVKWIDMRRLTIEWDGKTRQWLAREKAYNSMTLAITP